MAKEPASTKPWRTTWFWLLIGGAVLVTGLLVYSNTFKNLISSTTDWAKGIIEANPIMGAVVFFLFSALSAMLAFASTMVLVPAANLVWGKFVTFFLLWGGWIAGAIAAYGIGRVARPVLSRLGFEEKLKEYQQFVSKRMKWWAVLVFCLAVPSEIPGYLFGGLHYPFLRFISAIAIAEAIYAAGAVVSGESLITAKPLPLLITVTILIAVFVGASLMLRRFKKRKSRESLSR